MQTGEESTSTQSAPGPEELSDAGSSRSLRSGLYILPAFIVLVFILGWLFVFWLLHEDQDPHSLVKGMQQPGRRSWQKAYALSKILLDPDNAHLREDIELCKALDSILAQQNLQARDARKAGEPEDEEMIQFRAFLCRALGEFRLVQPLPTLLDCAAIDTSRLPAASREHVVRRAAIEAIALLGNNIGAEKIQAEPQTIDTLVRVIDDLSDSSTQHDLDTVSAAAFALGVIGGERAMAELERLLADSRPDVRYNAATGLSRHGRPECIPTLLEMLDPSNRTAYANEKTKSAQDRKQQIVLRNGIRATMRLLESETAKDQQLVDALQRLRDSDGVSSRVRIDAKEALLKLN